MMLSISTTYQLCVACLCSVCVCVQLIDKDYVSWCIHMVTPAPLGSVCCLLELQTLAIAYYPHLVSCGIVFQVLIVVLTSLDLQSEGSPHSARESDKFC